MESDPVWLLSHPCQAPLAERIAAASTLRKSKRLIEYKPIIEWGKFEDGFPNLFIRNVKHMAGKDIYFLASFHDPAIIFEQISILQFIPRYHAKSLTILMPFFVCATMERVDLEGQVATAKSVANLLATIPLSKSGPAELVVYDIHALQERFYFSDNTVPRTVTALPLLKEELLKDMSSSLPIAIAFPDDGARKRFGFMFKCLEETNSSNENLKNPDDEDFQPLQVSDILVCTKIRQPHGGREISLREGNPQGHHVIIVDDLVNTGGTLIECAKALKKAGASKISCYATHAVFPQQSWRRFVDNPLFHRFWVTDSLPHAAEICQHSPFRLLSLAPHMAALVDSWTQ